MVSFNLTRYLYNNSFTLQFLYSSKSYELATSYILHNQIRMEIHPRPTGRCDHQRATAGDGMCVHVYTVSEPLVSTVISVDAWRLWKKERDFGNSDCWAGDWRTMTCALVKSVFQNYWRLWSPPDCFVRYIVRGTTGVNNTFRARVSDSSGVWIILILFIRWGEINIYSSFKCNITHD